MNPFRTLRSAATTAALLTCTAVVAPLEAQQGVTAFRDVHVIPMDTERVLENHTVIVRDGRIAEIGPAATTQVPAGATVVEGNGRYLAPGYAELHAHIPTPQQQGGQAAVDRTLFLYLAGGVTTIRGMLGHPSHLELRERGASGEIVAPRIYTSGPSFSGGNSSDPAAAAAMVREQQEEGYDLVKLHPGLSRPTFDAIAAAGDEIDFPIAGHVSAEVGLDRALEAGYASIDHLDAYIEALAGHGAGFGGMNAGFFGFNMTEEADASRITELARATRDAGVWNVPTQSLMVHLASPIAPAVMAGWPEMRYMPPATIENWIERKVSFQSDEGFSAERAARYIELRDQIILALHEEGAPLALGSDAPQWWNVPGFSARRELRYMVDAGLSPFDALATGTRDAARYFDAEAEWGTIAPGRSADLLLFGSNPLEDIDNIWTQTGVMIRGHWISGEEVEQRLEQIASEVAN